MRENAPMATIEQRPVRLVVRDDLARSRLTVFFRLFLAIPLFVWLALRGIAAFVVGFVNWLAVLIQGEVPESLHGFVAVVRPLRDAGERVRLPRREPVPVVPRPVRLSRRRRDRPAGAPGPLGQASSGSSSRCRHSCRGGARRRLRDAGSPGQSSWSASSGNEEALWWNVSSFGGVAAAAAVPRLVRHRRARTGAARAARPRRLSPLGYGAQAGAYLFLLTRATRPPTRSSPSRTRSFPSIRSAPSSTDDLERPRLTVLFRLFLAIPHFVWIVALVDRGRLRRLRRLDRRRSCSDAFRSRSTASSPRTSATRRTSSRSSTSSVAGSRASPGARARTGSTSRSIRRPRSSRWTILFRFFLAIPAFILASALGGVAFVLALLGWWYALVTARMPEGMRNLGVTCLRYAAQTYAYALLVTEPLPVRRAGPPRDGAGARGARRLPDARPRRHVLRIALVALGVVGARGSARSSSTRPPSRTISRSRPSTSTRSSAPTSSSARSATSASSTSTGCSRRSRSSSTLWIYAQARRGLRAGVVRRADRHGDAARDARSRASSGSSHLPFALAAHWWQRR